MKNVLLIGDLRTMINNYGACATSELLINGLKSCDINLKCIDARSMWNETPKDGWETDTVEYAKQCLLDSEKNEKRSRLRHFVKSIPIIYYLNSKRKENRKIFIPYDYSQYKEYADRVINGEKMIYEKKLIDNADIVLINSEGNIVKGTDSNGYYRLGGLYVLFIAYLSKVVLNKPTYIINHGVDPGNRDIIDIIKNVYPLLDGVFVRENLSIDLLRKWGVTNTKFVADALFLYNKTKIEAHHCDVYLSQRDYSKKLVCIGDSSGMKSPYNKVGWDVIDFYKKLINKYQENGYQVAFVDGFNGLNYDVNEIVKQTKCIHLKMLNCSFEELYKVFEEAEIYVSGRWHTSILAVQAGTPIILWGADSHKTEALYDLLDYKMRFFEVASLPLHIDDIFKESLKAINEFKKDEMSDKVKLLSDSAEYNYKIIIV